MINFSPAAQAVICAATVEACLAEWAPVNDPPCHPDDEGWNGCHLCVKRDLIAAALRAAADQAENVHPVKPSTEWGEGWLEGVQDVVASFRRIADELEIQP